MKFHPYKHGQFLALTLAIVFLIAATILFNHFTGVGNAQSSPPIWTEVSNPTMASLPGERWVAPQTFRGIRLNQDALLDLLAQAPAEGSGGAAVLLPIPMPGGETIDLRIGHSPIMEAPLAAQFPVIQTYLAHGPAGSGVSGRLDWTYAGFHAILFTPRGTVYLDPYIRDGKDYYVSYFKRDLRSDDKTFSCSTDENDLASPNGRLLGPNVVSGPTLRTYRTAVACTGEYSAFHGGTTAGALSAIVTSMNRVNGVYEREVGVRLILVANNSSIIYLDPNTDPYANNSGGTMLGQNQSNLDSVIGSANYDIGHVFSTGGGGVATLNAVCVGGSKARGVTGSSQPVGDGFDIDYVAHEMGHQFGGRHTFNGSTGACAGGNRSASAAYEPGSGSTIMAYAGICGAENLQPNSDDYFHIKSLEEILAFITTGAGNNCPVPSATGNSAPAVSAGASFTIPSNTPFVLTATGSDPDGHPLTYNWEQFDLGAASPPNTDNGNRPIFRSFLATASPSRTFPKLSDILNNTSTLGESLPTTTRALNFRVTARDNRAGGGGVRDAAIVINTRADAGPFAITTPNTAITWAGGSTEAISWNVANTDAAPISCANVRISLSTDGGLTFPITLAASTPNDGSESVAVPPGLNTTMARVKVEAIGNIFFDISNANFNITPGGGCSYALSPTVQAFNAGGGTASVNVTTTTGCSWTATPSASWITINSGSPGNGSGTVNYTVAANTGAARNGTITVADQTLTVNQAAASTIVRAKKADFDGDGKTDLSVWRGSNGNWLIVRSSNGQLQTATSGSEASGDIPVPGDYDGDGKIDVAYWRPSTGNWVILRSSDGQTQTTPWGSGIAPYNDVPVPGDYDGDGRTDLAVWRRANGTWFILQSSTGQFQATNWGAASAPYNDTPVQSDYDGDGKTDIAVWRQSDGNWYVLKSSNGQFQVTGWGSGLAPYNDQAVPADYDGDGKADIAVWRPLDGNWYILKSSNGQFQITSWGLGAPYNDVPVPGDYDGDGRADIGVWRSSTGVWFVIRSSNGSFLIQTHGQNGDTALPSRQR
jgi:hypothetical protein